MSLRRFRLWSVQECRLYVGRCDREEMIAAGQWSDSMQFNLIAVTAGALSERHKLG